MKRFVLGMTALVSAVSMNAQDDIDSLLSVELQGVQVVSTRASKKTPVAYTNMSQQELKAMIDSTKDKQQDFSKIQGRFNTRLLLSGANADEVIKERILKKKENAVTPLRALYDANASRLSNLILFPAKPTWSGYKDADEFSAVYPFVNYQFELLQKVFEAIREHGMSEGRHLSQNERSLLDAFQTSAKNCMEQENGLLVPFDSFYLTI